MEHDAVSAHAAGPNRSSVTHGIGTVTDIPDQPYDLYIYRTDSRHVFRTKYQSVLLHARFLCYRCTELSDNQGRLFIPATGSIATQPFSEHIAT